MGPLYKFEWFDAAYGLQLAGLIGFFFGFVLERAGFGDARKLTAVFYLRDFAVLKVMFTAIVVCMIVLLYFSVFGWIDLSRVHVLPTYVWPQLVGGLVLGIGFVMGGYCPTTSVVAAVSGKLDALIFLVGMILGVFLFAELFPLLEEFYRAGSMGPYLLSDVFGVHSGVIRVSRMRDGRGGLLDRREGGAAVRRCRTPSPGLQRGEANGRGSPGPSGTGPNRYQSGPDRCQKGDAGAG